MRIAAFLFLMLLISCNNGVSAQTGQPPTETDDPPVTGDPSEGSNGDTPGEPEYTAYFDADNAWIHLNKQVSLGFRVPGMPGHTACRRYIEQELSGLCDKVEEQQFETQLPTGMTKMYNIIGRFNLEAGRRIIIGAHWDTRPTADYNPPGQRDQPIDGANDGASGVAVLLELARVFSEHEPPVGVDLVFFDGEDYGPGTDMMFFGSKYFANLLTDSQAKSYNYGILVDMIGDKHLDIHPENNSEGTASLVYAVAYEVSRELGYLAFKTGGNLTIQDDHVYLIRRGIRMYDFIDFNYPDYPGTGTSYWHTTEDTVDKCSKDSLMAVGHTVENMVYIFPDLYAPDES